MRLGPLLWTRRPGALELPRAAAGHPRAAVAQLRSPSATPRTACRSTSSGSTGCATATATSTTCRSSSPLRAVGSIGVAGPPGAGRRRAARPRRAAVRPARPQRGRRRRDRGRRLERRARVDEVAAAHHQRDEPVHATCRSPTPRRPAPRCSARSRSTSCAAGSGARAARPVRRRLGPDALRHRRPPGRRGGRDAGQTVSVIVFVTDDAPVDRARLIAGARARRGRRRARGLRLADGRVAPGRLPQLHRRHGRARRRARVGLGPQRRPPRARARRGRLQRVHARRSPSGSRPWSTRAPSSRTRPTSRTR